MNALAEDQLGRLRQLLAGTGVTFGMYVGKTPRTEADDINALIDAAIALVARPRDLLIYSERARYEAAAWALANQASSCALDWRFQPEIDRCCDALAQFAPEFIPYAPPCWR